MPPHRGAASLRRRRSPTLPVSGAPSQGRTTPRRTFQGLSGLRRAYQSAPPEAFRTPMQESCSVADTWTHTWVTLTPGCRISNHTRQEASIYSTPVNLRSTSSHYKRTAAASFTTTSHECSKPLSWLNSNAPLEPQDRECVSGQPEHEIPAPNVARRGYRYRIDYGVARCVSREGTSFLILLYGTQSYDGRTSHTGSRPSRGGHGRPPMPSVHGLLRVSGPISAGSELSPFASCHDSGHVPHYTVGGLPAESCIKKTAPPCPWLMEALYTPSAFEHNCPITRCLLWRAPRLSLLVLSTLLLVDCPSR